MSKTQKSAAEKMVEAKRHISEIQFSLNMLQSLGYQTLFTVQERIDTSIDLHEIDITVKAVYLDKDKIPNASDNIQEHVEKAIGALPFSSRGSLRNEYPANLSKR